MDDIEYRMLRRTWFPVARIEDVDQGVVAGNILGVELVVYRVDGRTTVAEGRCPHRGMALWMGEVVKGCLECPYHGWLFEPETGACTEIPSLPAGSEPSGIALRTYPVREAYGHVWSCLRGPLAAHARAPGLRRRGVALRLRRAHRPGLRHAPTHRELSGHGALPVRAHRDHGAERAP